MNRNKAASLRRLFVLVLIGWAGTAHIARAATDIGVLTVETGSAGCLGSYASGFRTSPPIGAYSPVALTGGNTVSFLHDVLYLLDPCSPLPGTSLASTLGVSGFSSNPGIDWLTSVTCNGRTLSGSSAFFSYNAGTAQWRWFNQAFGLLTLTSTTCTIVHN